MNPTSSRSRFRMRAILIAASTVLFVVGARAQREQSQTPMTREERIKEHRDRIRQIIEERRKEQEQAGHLRLPPGAVRAGIPIRGRPGMREPGAKAGEPGQNAGAPNASNIKVVNCLLYLKPLDNIAVVGKRFATRVVLDNPQSVMVGKVSIALRYDPRVLSCVRVFDDQFRPYVVSPPHFEDQPSKGIVYYEAVLKQPRPLPKLTVLTLVWQTIRPSQFSDIQFLFQDTGPTTAITYNGKDMLGLSNDPYDGVINASLLIQKKETRLQNDLISLNRKDAIEFFNASDNPPGAVGLALDKPDKLIHVGDTFDVPIYFHNPDALAVDSVSLFIEFNPEVLEVIDWDRGNWIRRGTNIYDGDRHMEFPFDYLVRNEALNGSGTIDYRVGLSRPRALPSGQLATIRFFAKAPSTGTIVRFALRQKGERRTTSISYHGEDVLDLTGVGSIPSITFKVYPGK